MTADKLKVKFIPVARLRNWNATEGDAASPKL